MREELRSRLIAFLDTASADGSFQESTVERMANIMAYLRRYVQSQRKSEFVEGLATPAMDAENLATYGFAIRVLTDAEIGLRNVRSEVSVILNLNNSAESLHAEADVRALRLRERVAAEEEQDWNDAMDEARRSAMP
jgi:hypothetical protein